MTTSTTNAPTIFTAFTDLCDELGITPVDAGKKFTFSREVQIKLEPVRDFPVDQLHQVRDYAIKPGYEVRDWRKLIQEMHRLLQQSVMDEPDDKDPFAPWRIRNKSMFDGCIEWSHTMPDDVVETLLDRVEARRRKDQPGTQQP